MHSELAHVGTAWLDPSGSRRQSRAALGMCSSMAERPAPVASIAQPGRCLQAKAGACTATKPSPERPGLRVGGPCVDGRARKLCTEGGGQAGTAVGHPVPSTLQREAPPSQQDAQPRWGLPARCPQPHQQQVAQCSALTAHYLRTVQRMHCALTAQVAAHLPRSRCRCYSWRW